MSDYMTEDVDMRPANRDRDLVALILAFAFAAMLLIVVASFAVRILSGPPDCPPVGQTITSACIAHPGPHGSQRWIDAPEGSR